VVVLRAHQRMASHYQAHTYTDMTAITQALTDDGESYEEELASAKIRAALNLTRRAADTELAFALDLRKRLPQAHDMLMSGRIDVRRARTIDHETSHLTIGTARGVVERITEAAPDLTTGQLRARIKKLCIQVDVDEAKKRYDQAMEGRRVIAEPTVDGTADLVGLDLRPHKTAAAMQRINKIARSLRGNSGTRTMDRLRADVYLDLLLGTGHASRAKGVVHLTVDLDTLTGLTEHPGDLNGFAPVISDIARHITDDQTDAEWRYTITDTETGQPLRSGITTRRPTVSQRRDVETRDRTCVFPGCRMPATECDFDHTTTRSCAETPKERRRRSRPPPQTQRMDPQETPQQRTPMDKPLGHTYTTTKDPP
jgi:hypothetical protein